MISIIIPYMGNDPFDKLLPHVLKCAEAQTEEHEIIVEEQHLGTYIRKNRLLNKGIEKAKGDYIFFCDVDILFEPDFLESMLTIMNKGAYDVVYPVFFSPIFSMNKIADGMPLIKREKLEEYGKLKDLEGIGFVTFPLLHWLLKNSRFCCSKDSVITINHLRGKNVFGKIRCPVETMKKVKKDKEESIRILREMKVFP